MLKFTETKDGFVFNNGQDVVAVGVFEQGNFHLLHQDKLTQFNNPMQAFVHLRSVYEPREPSAKTLAVFNTPARAIDNMSKFKDNEVLKNLPKEAFYAYLPN